MANGGIVRLFWQGGIELLQGHEVGTYRVGGMISEIRMFPGRRVIPHGPLPGWPVAPEIGPVLKLLFLACPIRTETVLLWP